MAAQAIQIFFNGPIGLSASRQLLEIKFRRLMVYSDPSIRVSEHKSFREFSARELFSPQSLIVNP
jgi:hypothetical protein